MVLLETLVISSLPLLSYGVPRPQGPALPAFPPLDMSMLAGLAALYNITLPTNFPFPISPPIAHPPVLQPSPVSVAAPPPFPTSGLVHPVLPPVNFTGPDPTSPIIHPILPPFNWTGPYPTSPIIHPMPIPIPFPPAIRPTGSFYDKRGLRRRQYQGSGVGTGDAAATEAAYPTAGGIRFPKPPGKGGLLFAQHNWTSAYPTGTAGLKQRRAAPKDEKEKLNKRLVRMAERAVPGQ